jgi:hypothetical protein
MNATVLKRYGPLAGIVAVVAVIAIVATLAGRSDDQATDTPSVDPSGGYTRTTDWGAEVTLPPGVLPFSLATELGIDVDWPATCDTERGTAAVPSYFAPECYAPFTGDNGGATAQGVTADEITVVLYQAPENDDVLRAIAGAVTDDSPADVTATYQGFLPFFQEYYETYGRKVNLVVYQASGNAIDEVAARTAAAEIAQDIKPFAVWGGPAITTAFSDELTARGIVHIPGGGGSGPEYYVERDPYSIGIGMSGWQFRSQLVSYIANRLSGKPAEHAGAPELAAQERVFGLVYLDNGPAAEQGAQDLKAALNEVGDDLAVTASYRNPLDVSAEAPGIIARFKDAGVTTVLLVSDPLTPATFTRVATDQDYFPEWLVAGAPLADTTVFGRTYDQRQWANAFGISTLSARSDPQFSNGRRLYRWFTCSEPPAGDQIELIYPNPAVFFSALQGAGPNLTPQSLRAALFNANPTTRGLTNPSLSWGEPAKGRWPDVDYQGIDDVTELWWDAQASGPDENGRVGQGMYAYVDGGKRYLLSEWSPGPSKAFNPDGAVTLYTATPPGEVYPDYPSTCGS